MIGKLNFIILLKILGPTWTVAPGDSLIDYEDIVFKLCLVYQLGGYRVKNNRLRGF